MKHLIWLSLALLLVPTLAQAQDRGLVMMLSGFHHAPSLEELEATGLPMPEALIEVASSPDVLQLPRGRALDALGYYLDETTLDFAERFLNDPAQDNLFLTGRAVRLVGDHLAQVYPQRSLEILTPFANHEDVAVRMHLVSTLTLIRTRDLQITPDVDDVLLQIVLAERNQAVVQKLERRLGEQGIRALKPRSLQRDIRAVER